MKATRAWVDLRNSSPHASRRHGKIYVALIYSGLGDRSQAFEWLEKAYAFARPAPPTHEFAAGAVRKSPHFGTPKLL